MPVTLRARSALVLPLMLVAVLLATMFSFVPSADAMTRSQRIGNAIDIVRNQTGDPYVYGSAGPGAFDCSGLIYYSFRKAGFKNVPRTSGEQASFADRISKRNMRPGDLMFFHSGGDVYHVGVFAGWKDGERVLIHAPSTGQRVHRSKVWTSSWFAGTLR